MKSDIRLREFEDALLTSKVAREFTSPEAPKKYLRDHPKSDASKHMVSRVASRFKEAQNTEFLMSDLTGESEGKQIFWPKVRGYNVNDVEGDRFGITPKLEYTLAPSEDVRVTFEALGDGAEGGPWSTVIHGKLQRGGWKDPEDIEDILRGFEKKVKDEAARAKKDLEHLCGSQWELEFDEVHTVFNFKDTEYSAWVSFESPVDVLLGNTKSESSNIFYGTDDWSKDKDARYSNLGDMKKILAIALNWFIQLDSER